MIKRDPLHPTRFYVEPPVYGNYHRQGRSNYNSMREKLQSLRKADRSTAIVHHGPFEPSAPASLSWRRAIPPGTDVCLQFGKGSLSSKRVAPAAKRGSKQKGGNHQHHHLQDEILRNGSSNKKQVPSSLVGPLPSPCLTPRKQFYNVMWDPRIARGTTLIQFTTAQQAKCKYELDLNRSIHFRSGGGSSNKSWRGRERGESQPNDSNPSRRFQPPQVKVIKEPLSYEAFAPFLTETLETSTHDQGQSMDGDATAELPKNWMDEPPSKATFKKKYSTGVSQEVQTEAAETEQLRIDNTKWIVSNLQEKIPVQALLEATEEEELDLIRDERVRFEKTLLYREWQQMKKEQWVTYLAEWESMRFYDIQTEELHLRNMEERMEVIAFAQNAIRYCLSGTNANMKTDGFIDKASGAPFEMGEQIEKSMSYDEEAKKRFAGRAVVSREVVDSAIVQAVVHRFTHHMHDTFGRPHGWWLPRRKHRRSIDFDTELEQYLEESLRRRGGNKRVSSFASIYSDFDSNDELRDKDPVKSKSNMSIPEEPKNKNRARFSLVGDSSKTKSLHSVDSGDIEKRTPKKTRFSHIPGPETSADHHGEGEDDVDVLFKRRTSWTVLENQDDEPDEQGEESNDSKTVSLSSGQDDDSDKSKKTQSGKTRASGGRISTRI